MHGLQGALTSLGAATVAGRGCQDLVKKQRSGKMPYIIVTSQYPSHKAQQVGETYLEALKKYPPDESLATQVVPAAAKTTLEGIEVISISEPKEGKVEEALTRARDEMTMFLPIEGFEYSIDTYGTVTEAMSSIGMSVP
jgi:hypothetical protein